MHPTQNPSNVKEDIYQEVTNKLITLLENGTVPWKQLFKTSEHGFAQNYCTKHQYSGINWFLLNFVAEYEVPYYLTWKQIQTLGGKVIKGSQAEQIYYLNYYYKDKEGKKLTPTQVKNAQENEIPTEKHPYLRRYNVFNISCVEGIEWEQQLEKTTHPMKELTTIDRCEVLLDSMEDVPKIQFTDETKAYYSPILDCINCRSFNSFQNREAEAYYRVLFHELMHWTGHVSRLSRKSINDMQTDSRMLYAEEELVAELGACILASITEIQQDNLLQNSAAYLQSWLDCMKEDKRFIFRVAPQAENAVQYILGS